MASKFGRSARSWSGSGCEDVTSSPAFFDIKKLLSINAEWIRTLEPDEFVRRAEPFLTAGEPAERHWPRWRSTCETGSAHSTRSAR